MCDSTRSEVPHTENSWTGPEDVKAYPLFVEIATSMTDNLHFDMAGWLVSGLTERSMALDVGAGALEEMDRRLRGHGFYLIARETGQLASMRPFGHVVVQGQMGVCNC
ncbi:unnamed protein product (mitochondrion) [Plasmodiophora brassicae]|uniref:Uncharacterized protein n=1 Tax=Plasmodiophora brassicae TaxID=37360 RepID=A0A0G4IQN1_PLABS|nr:hypothetical protein PBRA_000983 [Plasmodiophora brassicae]SPQ97934.1 unnamed protein product [Plasmodiophora brassicae]